jgi:hypothetical protein
LTALEAAAVIRRTPGALEQWQRDPNHPLKMLRPQAFVVWKGRALNKTTFCLLWIILDQLSREAVGWLMYTSAP